MNTPTYFGPAILVLRSAALCALLAGCCGTGSSAKTNTPSTPASAAAAPTATPAPGAAPKAPAAAAICDNVERSGRCSEYAEKHVSDDGLYKILCDASQGKWSKGSCPTGKQVGSCADPDGVVTYYYDSGSLPYKVEYAKGECELMPGAVFKPVR